MADTRKKLIDEAGALEAALAKEDDAHSAATAERRARLDFLRDAIPSWYPKLKAAAALSVEGERYTAVIAARGNRSSIIDMAKVIAKLGKDEALKWVTIPLGKLRKLLPKHEHKQYILTERTGARSVEFIRKTQAKAA